MFFVFIVLFGLFDSLQQIPSPTPLGAMSRSELDWRVSASTCSLLTVLRQRPNVCAINILSLFTRGGRRRCWLGPWQGSEGFWARGSLPKQSSKGQPPQRDRWQTGRKWRWRLLATTAGVRQHCDVFRRANQAPLSLTKSALPVCRDRPFRQKLTDACYIVSELACHDTETATVVSTSWRSSSTISNLDT